VNYNPVIFIEEPPGFLYPGGFLFQHNFGFYINCEFNLKVSLPDVSLIL